MDPGLGSWWVHRAVWLLFGTVAFILIVTVSKRAIFREQLSSAVLHRIPYGSTPALFPAVTICPPFKFQADKVNFSMVFDNTPLEKLTDQQKKIFLEFSPVCGIDESENKTVNTSDIMKHIQSIASPLDKVFLECAWMNKVVNCSEILEEIITEEGLCYSFNLIPLENIYEPYTDRGLDKNITATNFTMKGWSSYFREYEDDIPPEEHYPRVVTTYGSTSHGLKLVLITSSDDSCTSPTLHHKMFIHSPWELPSVHSGFTKIPINTEVFVAAKPNFKDVPYELKYKFREEKLECFVRWDRHLEYFKIYSYSHCLLECLSEQTRERCNCSAFYMPRRSTDEVCKPEVRDCILKVEEHLSNLETVRDECRCKRNCNAAEYDLETITGKYHEHFVKHYRGLIDTQKLKGIHLSEVIIYVKDAESNHNTIGETFLFLIPNQGPLGESLLVITFLLVLSLVGLAYMTGILTVKIKSILKETNQLSPREED